MRLVRWILATLAACACIGAAAASAANGPAWPAHFATTPATVAPPMRVTVITLAMLPHYPWMQPVFGGRVRHGAAYSAGSGTHPVWVKLGGLTLPKLSR